MKSSVRWIFVFSFTKRTHREISHCGVWAVIRKMFDDGVSWSTVCTCYEKVVVSRVSWIFEFFLAFFAYRNVRRNYWASVFCFFCTFDYGEARESFLVLFVFCLHFIDACEWGSLVLQVGDELLYLVFAAFHSYFHGGVASVSDEAHESEWHCQTINEGPKAHALNDALYLYLGTQSLRPVKTLKWWKLRCCSS